MGQTFSGLHGMLNMKAAAHYVGVYRDYLRKILKTKNKPPHYKIGTRYFFRKEDLDTWLETFKQK